jgi:hypothetical protein
MRTLIQILCTVLGLSCVAGLSGVVAGHLWNRYADEKGLLRVSEIYERILTARAATTSRERPIRATSANNEE